MTGREGYREASCLCALFASILHCGVLWCRVSPVRASQAAAGADNSPAVTKVEPPSWWVGLTPEVMLLISGRGLEATKVECNLASLLVERTQASGGGKYLFVWLKFGAETKSGTAVCRITSPEGVPRSNCRFAARIETIRRFQGLATDDVVYLIMPDRFANGDPTNDEPADAQGRTIVQRRARITAGIYAGCASTWRI